MSAYMYGVVPQVLAVTKGMQTNKLLEVGCRAVCTMSTTCRLHGATLWASPHNIRLGIAIPGLLCEILYRLLAFHIYIINLVEVGV